MPHEYTHPNNTPLKCFNLIKRLLKLSLAFRVLFLFAGVTIPAIVLLSLNFAAVRGFKYMKWSGVMSFLIMMMLYYVFSSLGGNLSLILPATIVFAPTVVYFRKRRLLFSPNPYATGDYIEAFPASL